MYNLIISLLVGLFQIYIIKRFAIVFFNNKQIERWKEIMVYFLFYLLNTGLYLEFHLPLLNIITSILGLLGITFLYSQNLKKNIFVTASIYLIELVCDAAVALLFVDITVGKGFEEKYEVLVFLLIFICELVVERIIKYREPIIIPYHFPLIMLPICSIVILNFLIFESLDIKIKEVIVSIGILFINFFVLYLYDLLIINYTKKYEKDMLLEKVNIYANQIEIISQAEDRVKRLRHDMRHHMNEIKILSLRNDTSAVLDYIEQMEGFLSNSREIISSGNIEMDSLLNYMLQNARERLKSVKAEVKLPENMRHMFDINVILGNLLENAIEAAQKTEDKSLEVSVWLKQGVLRIKISNSYSGKLIWGPKGLISTKGADESHGIGLESVGKIVDKYHGAMDIWQSNQIFTVKIVLYI